MYPFYRGVGGQKQLAHSHLLLSTQLEIQTQDSHPGPELCPVLALCSTRGRGRGRDPPDPKEIALRGLVTWLLAFSPHRVACLLLRPNPQYTTGREQLPSLGPEVSKPLTALDLK